MLHLGTINNQIINSMMKEVIDTMSENYEHLQIVKDLLKGAVIGLSAYVKPGGVHRLAPGKTYDEVLCNLISSVGFLAKALETGSSVRRGEQVLTSVDIGKLLSNVLKELFRSCRTVHPQYITPLVIGGFAIGLSGVESIVKESAKFKKALELANSISKWSSIKQFIETLKTVGREDMYNHLSSLGYTEVGLLQLNVSYNDLYRVLGSKWRGFLVIETGEVLVFTYLKRLSELYKKYHELAMSTVALYMELIKPHVPQSYVSILNNVESCGYMSTPECSKLMIELDVLLRRGKHTFEWASEITTLVAAFASFEGYT